MTTLTGVWGNVVVRNNELVPFNTDKFMDAINIDRGYSPLYEYCLLYTSPSPRD